MRSTVKRIRGFAIVSAIFILVVLAALGTFIVNVSTSQQIGSALDVQGVRAYQAARAGIEWGLFQVQSFDPTGAVTLGDGYRFGYDCVPADTGSQCPNRRSCTNANTGASPIAVFGFTVTVTCAKTDDPNGGPTVYSVTSTACSQANSAGNCPNTDTSGATVPGSLYVERRLSVIF